jgi:hypothetical protein
MNKVKKLEVIKEHTLMLNSNWILKNDGDKIILYLLSNDAAFYFDITFQGGIIISLFDGTRCVREVIEATKEIFSCEDSVALHFVSNIIIPFSRLLLIVIHKD